VQFARQSPPGRRTESTSTTIKSREIAEHHLSQLISDGNGWIALCRPCRICAHDLGHFLHLHNAEEKPALCKESKFKVIFETRDRDHSLTLLFHAPKIDGRWNVARLFQTLGGLQKLLPSVEDLVLGFGAMTVEHQLYLYSESSMMGTMSRYLMSRSFSRLKNLTLGKVITTEDELWQFIVRHRETLNSLTFRNVCLSQDVSTGAFNGAAPKVGIVKLLREETQFKDLAFHDEGTIHARRGGHVDV